MKCELLYDLFRAFITVPATFCFLTFPPSLAQSETPSTRLYYFGGAGERADQKNQFDSSFSAITKLSEQKNWKSTFQVDTGHPSTQLELSKLSDASGKNVSEFSTAAFERQVGFIIRDLEDGKLARGEQLLITIDTHGLQKDSNGQSYIETVDGTTSLSEPVQRLIKSAKRNGIKLGFILTNCYSGDIRAEFGKTDDACIISGSAPGRIAMSDFHKIFESIEDSANLEELYLASRQQQIASRTQPGISTNAGFRAERDLEIFKNYLAHPVDSSAVLADRLCENTPLKLNRLIELAKGLDKETGTAWYNRLSRTNANIASELKSGLESIINRTTPPMEKPGSGEFGTDFKQCQLNKKPKEWPLCAAAHADPKTLVRLKDLAAIYKEGKTPGTDPDYLVLSSTLKTHQQVTARIKEIEKNSRRPEVLRAKKDIAKRKRAQDKWKNDWKQFAHENKERLKKENKLIDHERKLYDALYRHYSKSEKKSNACRDFKLK